MEDTLSSKERQNCEYLLQLWQNINIAEDIIATYSSDRIVVVDEKFCFGFEKSQN